MRLFLKKSLKKAAQAPGTMVYVGKDRDQEIKIHLLDFSENHCEEKQLNSLEECFAYKDKKSISWINVSGVHRVELIEKLGKHFDIHPLALEDIVHTDQRPKLDVYDNHLYTVAKMITYTANHEELQSEQISILLGKNFVLTFQELEGDIFDPIRHRIKNTKWREKKLGSDYLFYALLDAIVDHYFVLFDKLGDKLSELDEELTRNATTETLDKIHQHKKELIYLRKHIWPLREVLGGIGRSETPLIKSETGIFIRDVYDHLVQVLDILESMRETLSSMRDLHLSNIGNKTNEVMKVLTIIATVFIPPTFIAGIYGMNFENMPELKISSGYFFVLGVIAIMIIGMLMYFKRKKWL